MSYKPVKWHHKMVGKVLADPEAKAEYDAFSLQLNLAAQLKKRREQAKLTQEQVADRMITHKPIISRMESITGNNPHSPSVITLWKYANAVGCNLKIILTPKREFHQVAKIKRKIRKK
jgi:transcriptional regulator with XRE-family HTH domain